MQNWLKTVLIGVLLGFGGNGQASESAPVTVQAHGVHGMLLFGEPGRVFASHLPLYRHPHDWQVVLELEPTSEAAKKRTDELLAKQNLLTLEPEHFDLLRLHPGATNPLQQFKAALYAGHFERGGNKQDDVDWRVKRSWWFEPVQVRTDTVGQHYFVIGTGPGKQWLLHQVERRPDVDQILAIVSTTALTGMLNSAILLNNGSVDAHFRVSATVWQDADDLQ